MKKENLGGTWKNPFVTWGRMEKPHIQKNKKKEERDGKITFGVTTNRGIEGWGPGRSLVHREVEEIVLMDVDKVGIKRNNNLGEEREE